jgi:cell division protein ZapD
MRPMMLFEYPLHERTRLFLRLENTFSRLRFLANVAEKNSHHAAMMALFELLEIVLGRTDLKSELLQEIEKQRTAINQYQNMSGVNDSALKAVLAEIDGVYQALVQWTQRPGQHLRENEWLNAIRARSSIPGGMCEFDLPNYHSWLNLPASMRERQLEAWIDAFTPLENCLNLSLRLLRGGSAVIDTVAVKGQLQQDVRAKPFQLLRIWIDEQHGAVPEISASKFVVWIRLMQRSTEFKSNPLERDVPMKLALCALSVQT